MTPFFPCCILFRRPFWLFSRPCQRFCQPRVRIELVATPARRKQINSNLHNWNAVQSASQVSIPSSYLQSGVACARSVAPSRSPCLRGEAHAFTVTTTMSAIMANHHPSPPMQMQMHHGPPGPARPPVPQSFSSSRQTLLQQTEAVWIQLGNAPPLKPSSRSPGLDTANSR